MKRGLVLFSLLSILLMPMFANGTAEKSGSANEVTLKVLWFNDANESDVFLDTIKDYLAANPNVKVDMQVVAFSEYDQKLKLMISGGNPPDLARVTNNHLATMITALEPIDGYVSDIKAVKANFMPTSIAFAENGQGQLCAYPTEATANGMLVNLDAWDKAGIDVRKLSKTWTWDQWEEAVKKVVSANDTVKYGLALDFTPHRFSTIMYEMGGHFLNKDQTGMDFNNPGTLATLTMLKKFQDEGLMPKSVWLGSENPAELFQAGLVACHIGGSWNINTYNKNVKNFKWCAVSTPKGEINSSVPGGKFVAAFKDSANKVEAMKLMAAFSDKAHNEQYCRDTFNLSARVDAAIAYPSNTEDFAVFQHDLSVTPAFTANEWKSAPFSKVSAFIRDQIVQVFMGNLTPEAAAKAVDVKGATYF
ncbi:sugar ABC transporter substrate-binding protein [uncultured Sphaerochaeta sp.]|uniref:ABC transporter substrate-binding protein n=1 Tax=uncultured Sphaerochaeta sp. TaxID=886478 RepID=UPI002A0A4172|nr:sugar ABC transporter substrate-binding protein [uncultured Sphaerochaeta sp.]